MYNDLIEQQAINVAILDSGISTDIGALKGKISGGIHLYEKDNKVYSDNNYEDYNGHGTSCASLIQRKCPNVKFFIMSILNSEGTSSSRVLLEALTCLLKSNIKIINLSISTMSKEYVKELADICQRLENEGKIIICSLRKSERYSFPAVFPSVIGIKGMYFWDENTYWFNRNKAIQCIADNTPIITPKSAKLYQVFSGNSKSAALFTGILANMISNNKIIRNSETVLRGTCSLIEKNAAKTRWTKNNTRKLQIPPAINEERYINNDLDKIAKAINDKRRINDNLDKITKVICDKIGSNISDRLLYSLPLSHPYVGFKINQMVDIVKGIEKYFDIEIDYESVSGRDFLSIYTLRDLVDKYI